jgi:hypothetical protein
MSVFTCWRLWPKFLRLALKAAGVFLSFDHWIVISVPCLWKVQKCEFMILSRVIDKLIKHVLQRKLQKGKSAKIVSCRCIVSRLTAESLEKTLRTDG